MRRELFGDSHEHAAISLRHLSTLAHIKEDLPRAEALIEEALVTQRTLHGERHPAVAGLMHDVGMVRPQRGATDAAVEALDLSLAMRRSLLGEDHPDIADTLNALGMAEQNRNQLDLAESRYREALAIRTRVLVPRHATTRNNLASVLYQRQDFAAAAPTFRETLEQWRETLGELDGAAPRRARSTCRTLPTLRKREGSRGASVSARTSPDPTLF